MGLSRARTLLRSAQRTRSSLARLKLKLWKLQTGSSTGATSAHYWTQYNVTGHHQFRTREESLDYYWWRTSQYVDYNELMPCAGHDDRVIVDFGCGPGHDLIGFVEFSRPRKVYGLDVSASSLAETRQRLQLHPGGDQIETVLLDPTVARLPLEDSSIDYIHSSGVLHHLPDDLMERALTEFARALKPGGLVRIMVYNYDSIWLHLEIAWRRRLIEGVDADVSLEEAVRRNTDGPDCPVSRCYRPEEFVAIASRCGLSGKFLGAAIGSREMDVMPRRYQAILDRRLPRVHREFLLGLRFDDRGVPSFKGQTAGFDGIYEFRRSGGA